jgi:hypothetical protein
VESGRWSTVANSDGRVRAPNPIDQAGIGAVLAVQPTKWSVLAILALRPASVAELARDLEAPLEAVRGYVEDLEAEGSIEPVERKPADGPVRWRMHSMMRVIEIEEWERLSSAEREEATGQILELIDEDVKLAVESGTITRRLDMHLARIGLTVDEQGWRELGEIHRAAAIASQKVQVESAKRLRGSGEKGINGRSTQMLFELPEA